MRANAMSAKKRVGLTVSRQTDISHWTLNASKARVEAFKPNFGSRPEKGPLVGQDLKNGYAPKIMPLAYDRSNQTLLAFFETLSE